MFAKHCSQQWGARDTIQWLGRSPRAGGIPLGQALQRGPPKRPRIPMTLSSGVKGKAQNKMWLPFSPERQASRDRVWSGQLAGDLTRHEGLSLRCKDGGVNWALPGLVLPSVGPKTSLHVAHSPGNSPSKNCVTSCQISPKPEGTPSIGEWGEREADRRRK